MVTLRAARDRARILRRGSTDAERVLWRHLRNRGVDGVKFRRQVPIAGITVDFACVECRLVIEVDGGQHADQLGRDRAREALLRRHGYKVLRFWNNDVLGNLDGVVQQIAAELARR